MLYLVTVPVIWQCYVNVMNYIMTKTMLSSRQKINVP